MTEHLRPSIQDQDAHDPFEPDPFVDTWGIHLDRKLQIINASIAYFDEHPEVTHYTYQPPVPIDDIHNKNKYAYSVSRETVETIKRMALSDYEDLAHASFLGKELAEDIVQSWREPIELAEGQILTIKK